MIYQTIPLPIDYERIGAQGNGYTAAMTLYLPDNSPEIDTERRRPTVVVLPGGGYGFRSDREAEPLVFPFLAADCNAVVVDYSIEPTRFPAALLQVAQAVALLREHAEEWHVDENRIAVMGFSAGGHLAASYGTLWNSDIVKDYYGYTNRENRPDGMILCYAVISSGDKAHRGSIDNLLGDKKDDPALLELVSCEKQVTRDTPPAFIWHTWDDGCVPVENALLMATALREKDIPFELHVYPHGQHGLSLANENVYGKWDHACDEVQSWIGMAIRWMKAL